jgi:hypothetical protein
VVTGALRQIGWTPLGTPDGVPPHLEDHLSFRCLRLRGGEAANRVTDHLRSGPSCPARQGADQALRLRIESHAGRHDPCRSPVVGRHGNTDWTAEPHARVRSTSNLPGSAARKPGGLYHARFDRPTRRFAEPPGRPSHEAPCLPERFVPSRASGGTRSPPFTVHRTGHRMRRRPPKDLAWLLGDGSYPSGDRLSTDVGR